MNFNADNERIKHAYFQYLQTAGRKSPKTVEQARKSIIEYEKFTNFASFKSFNKYKAIDYKHHLAFKKAKHSQELIKPTTLRNLIKPLMAFLRWLAYQASYKTAISPTDIDYLELSENEARAGILPDYKEYPTLDILKETVLNYPIHNDLDRRDQALMAFMTLTAMRDDAVCSLKLRHIDINKTLVKQYAYDGVTTKFRKNFVTHFFPVGIEFETVFLDYYRFLRKEKLFDDNDPLFPKALARLNSETGEFIHDTLSRDHLAGAGSIRTAFQKLYAHSGIRYYKPHTIRDTITQLSIDLNLTLADSMAWSLNMGHNSMKTTYNCYGGKMPDNERMNRLKALRT